MSTTTTSKRLSASAFLAMMLLMMMILIDSSSAGLLGKIKYDDGEAGGSSSADGRSDNERALQADAALNEGGVVELLESQALPAIAGALNGVLAGGNFNPIVIQPQETTFTNGDIPLPPNATGGAAGGLLSGFLDSCNITGTLTFEGAEIYGLQNLTVAGVELVEDSQEVELDFSGVFSTSIVAATWAATFAINVTTPLLSVVTADALSISADVCGIPMSQTVAASVSMSNPSIVIVIRLNGETENLQDFQATSEVSGAVVEDLLIEFDSMFIDIDSAGTFGDTGTNYTVTPTNETDVISGFTPLLIPLMQNALDAQLPITPGSDFGDIAVSRVP